MDSKKVKIFTILFLAALVIVTFYATSKQKEREDNGISTVVNEEKENKIMQPNKEKEETKPIIEDIQNKNTDDKFTTLSEDEGAEVLQYKIPNCYVLGNETSYTLNGYKYFIVKSQNDFKNYLSTRLLSSENDEIISFNTEEIEEKINEQFFKTGSVIIVVDYNQNKKINERRADISLMQDDINIKLEKNNNSKVSSNFITYIIPIETRTFKNVVVTY